MPGDRIFFLDDDDELNFRNFFYKDYNASIGVYDMTSQEVSSPLPTVCYSLGRTEGVPMRSPGCITIYLTVAWCFGYSCETCMVLNLFT
jgi:hypothetical protein